MTYTIRLRYSDTAEYEILIFIIDEKGVTNHFATPQKRM